MNEPTPIRPAAKRTSPAAITVFVIVSLLALLGVVETVVLITLAVTGQIG
jgi:hypothetical protein